MARQLRKDVGTPLLVWVVEARHDQLRSTPRPLPLVFLECSAASPADRGAGRCRRSRERARRASRPGRPEHLPFAREPRPHWEERGARVDSLEIPVTSSSPATLRSPPTITASGLSTLQRPARIRPISRPASVTTLACADVSAGNQVDQVPYRQLAECRTQQFQDRIRRRDCFQASSVTATADCAVASYEHVAELSSEPGTTAV